MGRRRSTPQYYTILTYLSKGIKVLLTIAYVATFSIISPIGAGIGIALSETVTSEASVQTSFVTVLQGLAAGTLLYVVFFEIIEKERQKKTNGILMVSAFTLCTYSRRYNSNLLDIVSDNIHITIVERLL